MAPAVPSGDVTYAVCFRDGSPSFHFMPAVAVSALESLPDGFAGVTLPPQTYAVFPYHGTREGIGDFRYALTSQLWPNTTYRRLDAPKIEVYGPQSGNAENVVGMELWVAVAP